MNTRTKCHWCGANVPELQRENERLRNRVAELEKRTSDNYFAAAFENDKLKGLLALHEQQLESEQLSKGKLIRDNARLRELLRDACKSFECYAAHDKPKSQWDEYDHMMNPIWKRIKAAIGEGE